MKRTHLQLLLCATSLVVGTSAALAQGSTPAQSATAQTQGATGQKPAGAAGEFGRHSKHDRKILEAKPGDPMWRRYLIESEKYKKAGDAARSKQYLFEALNQFEKEKKKPAGNQLTMSIARLEKDLMHLYPNYPMEKPEGTGAKQIKLDDEEIAVLSRINKINQAYQTPNGTMAALVSTQIKMAQKDKEKNVQMMQSQGKDPSGKDGAVKDATAKDGTGKDDSDE